MGAVAEYLQFGCISPNGEVTRAGCSAQPRIAWGKVYGKKNVGKFYSVKLSRHAATWSRIWEIVCVCPVISLISAHEESARDGGMPVWTTAKRVVRFGGAFLLIWWSSPSFLAHSTWRASLLDDRRCPRADNMKSIQY